MKVKVKVCNKRCRHTKTFCPREGYRSDSYVMARIVRHSQYRQPNAKL